MIREALRAPAVGPTLIVMSKVASMVAVAIWLAGCGGCMDDADAVQHACPAPWEAPADGFVDVPLEDFSAAQVNGPSPTLTSRCGEPVWRFADGTGAVRARITLPSGCYVRAAIIVAGGAAGRMTSRLVVNGHLLGFFDLTSREGGTRDLGLRAAPPSEPAAIELLEILSADSDQELHSARVSFACSS